MGLELLSTRVEQRPTRTFGPRADRRFRSLVPGPSSLASARSSGPASGVSTLPPYPCSSVFICGLLLEFMGSVVMRCRFFASSQCLQQLSDLQVQSKIPRVQFNRREHRLVRLVVLTQLDER